MFIEMKPIEKQLMQSIEDILNNYSIPRTLKGQHIRRVFDQFYIDIKEETPSLDRVK